MRKLMKTFRKVFSAGEKGFTLIELLVVVGILGALAAVVVLNVAGFIGEGTCEGYCTEKHNVTTACVAAQAAGDTTPSDGWQNYVIGKTKFTWTGKVTDGCKVIDASDKPSGVTCDCFD